MMMHQLNSLLKSTQLFNFKNATDLLMEMMLTHFKVHQ